jgi:hypothetical protein
MANQGFVHFDNSSVLAHTSGDAELIAKVDEGWIELKGESQRDYHVYEEGRLVTPTKWTLQGAWNKVRDSTNPKWYVEDVLHTQGDKPFITQGGDVYDNYPANMGKHTQGQSYKCEDVCKRSHNRSVHGDTLMPWEALGCGGGRGKVSPKCYTTRSTCNASKIMHTYILYR